MNFQLATLFLVSSLIHAPQVAQASSVFRQCGVSIGDEISPADHRHSVGVENLPRDCDGSDSITVTLPDGTQKTFHQSEASRKRRLSAADSSGNDDSDYLAWDGSDGELNIFQYVRAGENGFFGSFVDVGDGVVYQFSLDADGNEMVKATNSSDFPPETDPEGDEDQNRRGLKSQVVTQSLRGANQKLQGLQLDSLQDGLETHKNTRRSLLEDGSVIDVMVVWTAFAECVNSDQGQGCTLTSYTENNMRFLINLAIAETNSAYLESGVNTRLHLAHAYRHPTYDKTGSSFNAMLGDLADPSDGVLDDIHGLRRQHKADMVAMIVENPDSCGIAYIGPGYDRMFSVTHRSCATGYYTFGHELGHNQGCLHDRATAGSCSTSTYPEYHFGYRDPNAQFRSVLAYNCESGQCDNNAGGGCTRVPRFSNPNIPYDGQPIGDVWNDNARKINDVSAIIASYYQHSSACGSTPCSDGDICNGVETCDRLSGQCVAGIPTLCDSSFGCSSLPQCTAALTSTFNGGNRGGGNFFQVDALSHLFITRFDIHILQETHVQVYTKTGNYVGFESDSTAWTLIHSEEMGNPEGDGNATPLSPFDGGAVEMLAGSTQSFYVLSTNPLEYTNGEGEGGVFREDAHLRIREGKGSPSFFSTSTFSPRIFNGNIEYITHDELQATTTSTTTTTTSTTTEEPTTTSTTTSTTTTEEPTTTTEEPTTTSTTSTTTSTTTTEEPTTTTEEPTTTSTTSTTTSTTTTEEPTTTTEEPTTTTEEPTTTSTSTTTSTTTTEEPTTTTKEPTTTSTSTTTSTTTTEEPTRTTEEPTTTSTTTTEEPTTTTEEPTTTTSTSTTTTSTSTTPVTTTTTTQAATTTVSSGDAVCTDDFVKYKESPWCQESQSRCEGPCNGFWTVPRTDCIQLYGQCAYDGSGPSCCGTATKPTKCDGGKWWAQCKRA